MSIPVNVAGSGARHIAPDMPPNIIQMLCKLLTSLLGRNVTAKKAAPYPNTPRDPRIVATYMDDCGRVISICVCDLPFVANAGAALLMLPVSTAQECIAAREWSPDMLENLGEILNICRQCFQGPGRHVAAQHIYTSVKDMPAAVIYTVSSPRQRVDLELAIAGYGSGRLSIVM